MPIYDAFISYSHAKDKPIATALQSVVQRLGKRWYRRRALRVFRDDTSLAASPKLWAAIEEALVQSRFLILLASPEAAASQWVDNEVEYWVKHKGIDTLLIALTDGDLTWDASLGEFERPVGAPLPPALERRFEDEPKLVDLRAYRAAARPRDHRFMERCADFAAAVGGIRKDDLLSQELRQQRRALRLALSAVVTLFALSGIATWLWREAATQQKRAERTLAVATHSANDLVMDVAVKIRNRLGIPVNLVREILTRSRDLLDNLSAGGEISTELRGGIARVLRELATTLQIQGDIAAALEAAERSRDIMLGLLAEDAGNEQWQKELSLSYNRIGEVLAQANRRSEALDAYRLAFKIRKALADSKPDNAEVRRDLAVSYERIGDELLASNQIDEALDAYQNALDIRMLLTIDGPDNREWARDLSVSHEKMGDVRFTTGEFDAALTAYRSSLSIRQSLAAATNANGEAQRDVAVSHGKIGDTLREMGNIEQAIEPYRQSLAIRQKLAATDAGNVRWQLDLLIILLKLCDANDDLPGHYAQARAIADRLDAEGKLSIALKHWLQAVEQRLPQH